MQGKAGALAITILLGRKDHYDPAAVEASAAERGTAAPEILREVPFVGL